MSEKRKRGGEPGDTREFRGNDGHQEARDRGETVRRQVHQEGEAPLPYDHEQEEWLGTPSESQSPYADGEAQGDGDEGRRSP
jgi:hypothetical protein